MLKGVISDAKMLYPSHSQGRTSLSISLINIKGAIYFVAFKNKDTVSVNSNKTLKMFLKIQFQIQFIL